MALLPITKYGEPVLRKAADPVQDFGPLTQKLIQDMYETMYDAHGVGLAAPQVGLSLRLAVINVTPDKKHNQFVIINPRIVELKGTIESDEGCLSLPNLGGAVFWRASTVTVEAQNEKGETVTIKGEDLLARCLQHEIDHLDGKLIMQHASLKRRLEMIWAIKKLKEEGLW